MDQIIAKADATRMLAALDRLGPTAQPFITTACLDTALAIQARARQLIAKRTGTTARGITVSPAFRRSGGGLYIEDTPGYAVHTDDVKTAEFYRRVNEAYTQRGTRPSRRWVLKTASHQVPHVGLYLEYGTKQGRKKSHYQASRPWFAPALRGELPAHAARITRAIDDAIRASGLAA